MKNIIMTGFHDLDYILKGFRDSEMIFVGGRPAMGKTTFALNIAKNVTMCQNIPVLFYSLEMSKKQILVSTKDMVLEHNTNFIIDDEPGISVDELIIKSRKYKKENKIGLIIIDYVQLLRDEGFSSRQLEMSSITHKLKGLACELSIPIIIISQHPKVVRHRENHRPILSDLSCFGTIEQDLDTVIFLYRDECYNDDTEHKGIAEVIIAKHPGENVVTVEMEFVPEMHRFKSRYVGAIKIEITGKNIDFMDSKQELKYLKHIDFEKSILKAFLLRAYDLMDERFINMPKYKMRIYTFGKEENGVLKTTPVEIKLGKTETEGLNLLFWSNNYNSYEDVLCKIENILDKSIL